MFVSKDRVKETSVTTGTGAMTLRGASTGYQPFSSIGVGNTCYYCIVEPVSGQWEVGLGTVTSSTSLARAATPLSSSNSGAAVNFGAGVKDVFSTNPAYNCQVAPPMSVVVPAGSTQVEIQAAHDSLPAAGGTLWLLPGNYNITGTINITKPCTIQGGSTNDSSANGTSLFQQATNGVTFIVACRAPVVFRHLILINIAGGTGIRFQGTASNNDNAMSRVEGCTIIAGAIGLDFLRAAMWTVSNCYVVNTTTSGIKVQNNASTIQDSGDSNIQGCVISGSTGDDITWLGSGGLRIENNKLLGNVTYGINVTPAAGTQTADILMVGNSIEGQATGIRIIDGGVGLSNIVIIGNQFAGQTTNTILLNSATLTGVVISGNTAVAGAAAVTLVKITDADGVEVSGNVLWGNGGASVGIDVGASAVVNIGSNQYYTINTTVVSASTDTRFTGVPLVTFATLPTCADGSIVYCNDGTIASPVAGGGTGCIAKRLNGAWVGN